MFIFQLGCASLIQRIPSSGMRRNFKPTSHPHLLPSSPRTSLQLALLPGVGGGLQRGDGSQITHPLCQGYLGQSQTQAGKTDAGEAAQTGRTEEDSRHQG